MKTASIPLALVVVLGFVRTAAAMDVQEPVQQYAFWIGEWGFGFVEYPGGTYMSLGPAGSYVVPFTATQGLVGSCVIVVGLVALATVFTFRWQRKRAA
jgi:hypothetical protein